jgi:hypothetical protein
LETIDENNHKVEERKQHQNIISKMESISKVQEEEV